MSDGLGQGSAAFSTGDSERAFDLLAVPDAYFSNPHPWFKRLRDDDPFHANVDGSVLLTRYADVKQVWRDLSGLVDKSGFFLSKFGDGPLYEHHTTGMLFRDPPDHDRLRAIVNPFFSQASIAALRPFIEQRVGQLLDEVADRDEIDLVRDFASKLPISVICRILGVPQEDAGRIQDLGRQVLFPLNPNVSALDVENGHVATAAFKAYLLDHVEEARRRPALDAGASIINALVAAERGGTEVSENEILHTCILILNGGFETTANLIAQSIHALLEDPAALEQVRSSSEISPTAIEELIRYVSPLQLQGRRTTRSITLETGNGTIPPNTEVVLCQASANRDDRAFARPDALDLGRRPNNHVGFGAGVHVCIGRPLARLESTIAVPRFLRRFASARQVGPAVYNRNVRFRGLQTLPLALT